MAPITDIRAYATLGTDNLPRIIVRDSGNRIWIDSGQQVGTLSGTSQGACMIPYRPNASPQAWMYIAAAQDYKKYSAPDLVTGAVLEQNVGIEEQHDAPGACANDFQYTDYQAFAGAYAIYSGILVIASTSILLAPVIHRVVHRFHVPDDDKG